MMLRLPATLAAGGLIALISQPELAAAQLSVGVQLSWHWSDGGWHSQRAEPRRDTYYAPAPYTRYRAPARSVRIPPGHLPPPGTCRLWYVGRPPGHQPPPTSCAHLFRGYRQPGVIILQGGPAPRGGDGWYGYDPRYDREYRYDRPGERAGKGNKGKGGRGGGRGRGGGG
jgi:hypothetical protein